MVRIHHSTYGISVTLGLFFSCFLSLGPFLHRPMYGEENVFVMPVNDIRGVDEMGDTMLHRAHFSAKHVIYNVAGDIVENLPEDIEQWIHSVAVKTTPDDVRIFLGTDEEIQVLQSLMVANGTLQPLDSVKRPNCFLALSNPDDVARVEDRTFICTTEKADTGPTNNWVDPHQMRTKLDRLFSGSMQGRVMYVVPFSMGPVGSSYARYGIEITDSPYVALNLAIMTRLGPDVVRMISQYGFIPCVHSVGAPLKKGDIDTTWPCNTKEICVAHFPETLEVWSYGSGYGGNALLNKKSFALRLASYMAKDESWLAEHMLIIGITNPQGKKRYIAASFPSACGKTNLAMLTSPLPGWKVECIGDDIAWIFKDPATGQFRAINPEFGFFGVAPGTSEATNPNAMKTIEKNTLFTNVGKTADGDIWWEGIGYPPSSEVTTWLHEPYVAGKNKAAHPNSRFTAPFEQCPSKDENWNNPEGVPISAFVFGGRRKTTIPLVREAINWTQGVFFGASMTSETTSAAKGVVGQVRHDPFGMLPFCGYNMADYFSHWLSMGMAKNTKTKSAAKFFYVNWFLQDTQGDYLWPGFSANMYVLEWIMNRLDHPEENETSVIETPIGYIPKSSMFNAPPGVDLEALFHIDPEAWKKELEETKKYFSQFQKERFPQLLLDEVDREIKLVDAIKP